MKFIIITILCSVFLNASMSRNLNTVYDTKHNMAWQDTNDNIKLRLSYDEAVNYCEHLKFSGKTNWHLPSRDEYKLILDNTRTDEHHINRAFKYSMPVDYWTSDTTWRNFGRYAYFVLLKSGTFYYNNKTYKKFVRCVR